MPAADPPQDPPADAWPSTVIPDGTAWQWPTRALVMPSQQVEAYLNRAQAQIQLQRWTDALASLEAVIALQSDHARAHELRAQVLFRLDRR
jgi:Tfp pilus assembly protein PilF